MTSSPRPSSASARSAQPLAPQRDRGGPAAVRAAARGAGSRPLRQETADRADGEGVVRHARERAGTGDHETVSDALCHVRRAEGGGRRGDRGPGRRAGAVISRSPGTGSASATRPCSPTGDACPAAGGSTGEERPRPTCWASGTSPSTPTGRWPGSKRSSSAARTAVRGVGRALMSAFERWAAARDCGLIALATRRGRALLSCPWI